MAVCKTCFFILCLYLIRYIHCSDLRLVCKVSCYVVFVDLIERGISSSDLFSFFLKLLFLKLICGTYLK